MKQKVLSAFALMTLVVVGLLLPAPASAEVTADCKSVSFNLVDRADTGTGGHVWAKDTMTRTLKVCATDETDGLESGQWWYSATVTDNGTFVTQAGKTPRGEEGLAAGITGTVKGGFRAHFTADRAFGGWTETELAQGTSSGSWVKTVLPSAEGTLVGQYRWSYKTACESYLDDNGTYTGDITSQCVSAKAPTVDPPTCDKEGTVTETAVTGVRYQRVEKDGTVGLVAHAEPGFKLTGKTRFGPYPVAKMTGPQCEQPPALIVVDKLNEPHVAKVDCDGVTWWVDDVKGVTYTTNDEYGAGWFTVVAKADKGYVIKEGLKAEWRLTYEMPDCTSTPQPGDTGAPGTGTPANPGSGGSVGSGTDDGSLPKTGVAVLGVAGVGGLLVAIGGLLFVWARRRKEDATMHGDNDATLEMRAI